MRWSCSNLQASVVRGSGRTMKCGFVVRGKLDLVLSCAGSRLDDGTCLGKPVCYSSRAANTTLPKITSLLSIQS